MRYLWLCLVVFAAITTCALTGLAKGNEGKKSKIKHAVFNDNAYVRRDTVVKDSLLKDSINIIKRHTIYNKLADSVNKKPYDLSKFPGVSLP